MKFVIAKLLLEMEVEVQILLFRKIHRERDGGKVGERERESIILFAFYV